MVTAICHLARFATLKVRLMFVKDQAKAFRMLCEFEKKLK